MAGTGETRDAETMVVVLQTLTLADMPPEVAPLLLFPTAEAAAAWAQTKGADAETRQQIESGELASFAVGANRTYEVYPAVRVQGSTGGKRRKRKTLRRRRVA